MSPPSCGAAGVRDRDVLAAAVLHDCAKGDTGPLPRIAWSLGEAYGPRVWSIARRVPGWDAALTRLETHAEASALLVESAGLPPFAVDLVRYQAEPRDPTLRARVPRRGRGLLMVVPGSGATPPTIAFGEGRRPEAATHVTLPAFDGPLALLLALIEARQLDVLTVPLGSLAGAYLEALAALEDDRMGNVSTFVAIASQLILIKSRAMLPRRVPEGAVALADEGPDPEAELRARLILYRAFRDAGGRLLDEAHGAGRAVPSRGDHRARRRPRRRPAARRRAALDPGAARRRARRARPGRAAARLRRPRPSAARCCSPTARSSSAARCGARTSSCSRTCCGACATGSSSR